MSSAATSLLGQKRSCDTTRDEDRRIARRADLDGSPRSSRAGSVVSSRDYSEETRRTDARSTQRDEDGRHRSHREDRDARRDRDATRPREQGRSDRDRTKDRERDRARDTDRDRERHGSHHSSRRREEPSRSSSSLHDRDDRERHESRHLRPDESSRGEGRSRDRHAENRNHRSRSRDFRRERRPQSPPEDGEIVADKAAAKPTAQPEPEPELELEMQEHDPQKAIEERRKRRQAILEKYAAGSTPLSQSSGLGAQTVSPLQTSARATPVSSDNASAAPLLSGTAQSLASAPTSDRAVSTGPNGTDSPGTPTDLGENFSLAKERETGGNSPVPDTSNGQDAPAISAADYDPSLDRALDDAREHELRRTMGAGPANPSGPMTAAPGFSNANSVAAGVGEPVQRVEGPEFEEVEVSEEEDDVDDMFALLGGEAPKKKKKIRVAKNGSGQMAPIISQGGAGASAPALHDNWDDSEGYYRIILGEKLDSDRYQVFANLGKGMFSSVVRARDSQNGGREVAIKIVRTQETMYKAGLKEMQILQKLRDLDPEDKKHIVRLERHFEHRGHLCMVFESLSMNLREIVKRFGKDVGLNLRAVRAYAHQMFLALSLMRKAEIMHADIKPDNILVNDSKTVLKVCDLGSASDTSENEITPYLVSRFYRAPEIMLGQPYDCALDMWSIGCTLYELATGKILFPGRTNNQMLLLIQECRGRFTTKQIRKARFGDMHFDESNNFLSYEKDKSTGQDTIRKVVLSKPTSDIRSRLLPGNASRRIPDDELRLTLNFVDLLNRTLELDPAKRITPKEALGHPFLT